MLQFQSPAAAFWRIEKNALPSFMSPSAFTRHVRKLNLFQTRKVLSPILMYFFRRRKYLRDPPSQEHRRHLMQRYMTWQHLTSIEKILCQPPSSLILLEWCCYCSNKKPISIEWFVVIYAAAKHVITCFYNINLQVLVVVLQWFCIAFVVALLCVNNFGNISSSSSRLERAEVGERRDL